MTLLFCRSNGCGVREPPLQNRDLLKFFHESGVIGFRDGGIILSKSDSICFKNRKSVPHDIKVKIIMHQINP
jgi:hypothetical protein